MTTAIQQSGYTPTQLRTIRQTVAADTNDQEFDLFMEAARSYGLDPFRRQIHAVVYNKKAADKRKMAIIVSRDGLRVIASRCHDYRPASEPAYFEVDPDTAGPTNPKGLVSCTVQLWKQDRQGDWHPVIGQAYWDEFAPVTDEWAWNPEENRRAPTGKQVVDGNWKKMPRVMLQKCAESQALRAGWPEQFGALYSEDEMHRLEAEHSASEALKDFERAERESMIGGRGLMFAFTSDGQLTSVPIGKVHDRCIEFVDHATPDEVQEFRVRNEAPLREFWAHDKAAALDLRKRMDAK